MLDTLRSDTVYAQRGPRVVMMFQPRRIPPWRCRDAEPGPIAVIILVSLAMLTVMWIGGFI